MSARTALAASFGWSRGVVVAVVALWIPARAQQATAVDVSKLPAPVARPVDFGRDVRPIFEKNCYKCHGPEKQRSGYRLDLRKTALTGGDGYAPNIIPGKSAESHLVHFVSGLDEDMLMPSKGDRLTSEQIGVLRAWIDQGADWPESSHEDEQLAAWKRHWSFGPLSKPPIPPSPDGRKRNPIDAFVLAKLNEKGLSLSPEADRGTLIRRLSFDLTGLPPTPEETIAFQADTAPGAYERLVERLLASPHYGERWARHWLDVVRFAESDGFERNNLRPNAWPYRDYVIRAFNDDKPYDQFMKEQLAGDALGVDEATGFLVGGAHDALQSFEPPEFNAGQRGDELYDIVSTTGSAFMGLSVGCARCHDHKFDPISQVDYYAMIAVFQGVEHGERAMRPANYRELMKKAELPRRKLAEIEDAFAPFMPLAQLNRSVIIETLEPAKADPAVHGEAVAYSPGTERGQAGDPGDESRLPTLSERYRAWTVGSSVQRERAPWASFPAGRFRVWISWSVAEEHLRDACYVLDRYGESATATDQVEIARVDQRTFADGSAAIPGERRWSGFANAGIHELTSAHRLLLRSGGTEGLATADVIVLEEVPEGAIAKPAVAPHLRGPVIVKANEERFAPMEAKFARFTALAANSSEGYIDELEVFSAEPRPRNVALAETGAVATAPKVDGQDGNPFYINDGRFNERSCWNSPANVQGAVQIEFPRPERVDRIVWSRNRSDRAPKLDENIVTAYRIELSLDGRNWRTVASSNDRIGPGYRKRVPVVSTLSFVPPERAGEVLRLTAERRSREAEVKKLIAFPSVYAGAFREPGPTFRLNRGDPLAKREQLAAAALGSFGRKLNLTTATPEQERRLAFADWLADPENPLPARVWVNRMWHYHFGNGIVTTPSDFGLNGARPTHPELLDWLAAQFVASGWRIKDLHRLILLSDAYRQSSTPHATGLEIDASSQLLWRFPPRRLEAEALRDTMLAVTGLLDLRIGGPGFNLLEANLSKSSVHIYTFKSAFSKEDFLRMVYQFKPRVQLDDVFGAFDCPDAGQIAPNRTRSTTPLQALNLLNSPFAIQQAAAFAARLEKEAGSDATAQVERAFLLAFGRKPHADESRAAAAVIRENGLPIFCRAIFNTNEFINVY